MVKKPFTKVTGCFYVFKLMFISYLNVCKAVNISLFIKSHRLQRLQDKTIKAQLFYSVYNTCVYCNHCNL